MGNSLGCLASGERLVSAARDRDLIEAKTLLEFNPGLAKYSTFGGLNSPLHFAAARGHNEIVALLLEKGADVNSRNYCGQVLKEGEITQSGTYKEILNRHTISFQSGVQLAVLGWLLLGIRYQIGNSGMMNNNSGMTQIGNLSGGFLLDQVSTPCPPRMPIRYFHSRAARYERKTLNRIIVKANATAALTNNGYLLCFEVIDDTGSTIFSALDREVQRIFRATSSDMVMLCEEEGKSKAVAAFEELLNVNLDDQITLIVFNNKRQTNPSHVLAAPKDEFATDTGGGMPRKRKKLRVKHVRLHCA